MISDIKLWAEKVFKKLMSKMIVFGEKELGEFIPNADQDYSFSGI